MNIRILCSSRSYNRGKKRKKMRSQIAYILEYWCILMNCSLVFEMSDSLNLSNQPLIIRHRENSFNFYFNPEKYRYLRFA